MPIDFYYSPLNSPCRVVLSAAKAIDVELNLIEIYLSKGEQLSPEFIKLNPQHTIPTINDNGFVLWESRAIITYLQNKYGKNDDLYPKNPEKRALVDQILYFDMDLYLRLAQVFSPKVLAGDQPNPEAVVRVKKALQFLDSFLDRTKYVAGDNLTLADLALVVEISNLHLPLKYDLSPYMNILRWYARVRVTAPGYKEVNEDSLVLVQKMIKKMNNPQ